ncbi:PQQ-dependent sugar dehydrogenase, partial [Streptomyces sp. NPDC056730]|uniref:PQQ-dependent sugar dehydrogenase n=1 Tax=Streptomyces sp. NPDC056730 TaxID=3345929 RepID=UPI0036BB84D0
MHRKRPRARTLLALLTGALLAGSSLSAVPAAAHPDEPAAEESFQQVTLAKGADAVGEPMSLAVLPDRRVLHTSRDGTLRITDAGGDTTVSGTLDVYNHDEEGLQGVGVDPDFAENRAINHDKAPKLDTPAGDAPQNGTAADVAP